MSKFFSLKKVCLLLDDMSSHEGFIKAIDPYSYE